MAGLGEERGLRRRLHQAAKVHHPHPVTDVAHHRKVMGDEQIRQAKLLLQVHEQVDDLRLNGDVQGGDRLIADHQIRLQRQGTGDADALALAAGELGEKARPCICQALGICSGEIQSRTETRALAAQHQYTGLAVSS